MKIVTILGARPQFIKAAALSRAVRDDNSIKEIIVHTGQHYDENMSDVFFEQMQIPNPHYNLSVKSSRHGQMTGQMLEGIESVLLKEQPDIVLVYGDTNSTLAGALAAKKLHMTVAHVEAGLRSYNLRMPEEINRILTDRISDYLFCPSQESVNNLKKEGFEQHDCSIHNVGDIMKDIAFYYQDKGVRADMELPKKFVLATMHRAENTDDTLKLTRLWKSISEISEVIPVIIPLHPRTRGKLDQLGFQKNNNVFVIDPVGYLQMVYLLAQCDLVITDSGGLQKEAYYFKKYCITIREETEWTELVSNGYNSLVGSDRGKIMNSLEKFLSKANTSFVNTLYGDGNTASKIVQILKTHVINTQ
jgi:UDP-GlcNAc3NAcA epimerase